jgi:hypothetical protein
MILDSLEANNSLHFLDQFQRKLGPRNKRQKRGLGSAAFFSAAEGALKAASRRSRKGCDSGAPSAAVSAEGARAADRGRAVLGARPSSPRLRAH